MTTSDGFRVSQLALNMEKTKIVKFTHANPSNSSLWITFGENFPVINYTFCCYPER
jgi:hypothetical protein